MTKKSDQLRAEAQKLERAADRLEKSQSIKDDCGCEIKSAMARGAVTVATAALFGVSL